MKGTSTADRKGVAAAGRHALLAAAVAVALAPAAAYPAIPRNIRFDRISIEQGLSEGTVSCMLQDATGFMWFGTQDGLNRYDGDHFLVLKNDPEDPASLSANWIRALLEDPSGDIWVGTLGGGLNRWHRATGAFSHFRHDPANPTSLSGNRVWALLRDRTGTLWVGTDQSGLNRFDGAPSGAATGTFERFRHDPDDPTSLSHDAIRVLYEDRRGRLWVGTLGGGLNLFDRQTGSFLRYRHDPSAPASLSDDRVRSVLEDRHGNLWVGTLGGLNRVVGGAADGELAFERLVLDPSDPLNLTKTRVRVLYEDHDGRLWVGTDNGLYLHQGAGASETFVHYGRRPGDLTSLSMNRVASIYQDRGGVLWFGVEGTGVNKWHPRTWSFSNDAYLPSDLSSNYFLSLTEDQAGNLWLGTNGHGLNRLHRATGAVTHFRYTPGEPGSLSDDRVPALLTDRRGVLWVGTLSGGLNRFGGGAASGAAGETFEHFVHDPGVDSSLGANGVMALHEDRRGVLWVGTFGGGLNRFEPATETFVRYRHDPADPASLADDRVTAFADGDGGVLWVGTLSGGLHRFEPGNGDGTFLRIQNDPNRPSSLSSDTILSLHRAPDGALWVGTHNGLNKLLALDQGEATFKSYFERHGLPSALINAVYSDAAGRLWLSTNKGLSRFDPATERFKNFDASHGLLTDEFNMGAHYQSPSGELILGGTEGFNAFYPEAIEPNTAIPPVVLTEFSKLNQPVRLERPIFDVDEIAIGYRDRVFSFEFAALDYTAPERNRYRYKLEGFDDDWIDLDHRRRVSFTNLDPGRYVFRVRGSNNDGVWNEQGASVAIVVAPPPWQTWWAYTLYGLGLAGVLGIAAYVYAQRQEVKRERAIAEHERERVRERERLLRERERLITELEQKNTELERFSYTVSHDLKSPLVTIKGFLGFARKDALAGDLERMEHDFATISEATDKMQRLLDELLTLARLGHQLKQAEEVPLAEVAREAVGLVDGLVAERAAEVLIAPDLPVVSADRGRLLEVFQNLIENALKYTGEQGAPRVEVGVQRNGADDVLYVRDNGAGIDPRYHEKVFGLFERLDASEEGTGLGLALVKRIVEMHGGRIWVESQLGHGSTFYFTLAGTPEPREDVPELAAASG